MEFSPTFRNAAERATKVSQAVLRLVMVRGAPQLLCAPSPSAPRCSSMVRRATRAQTQGAVAEEELRAFFASAVASMGGSTLVGQAGGERRSRPEPPDLETLLHDLRAPLRLSGFDIRHTVSEVDGLRYVCFCNTVGAARTLQEGVKRAWGGRNGGGCVQAEDEIVKSKSVVKHAVFVDLKVQRVFRNVQEELLKPASTGFISRDRIYQLCPSDAGNPVRWARQVRECTSVCCHSWVYIGRVCVGWRVASR